MHRRERPWQLLIIQIDAPDHPRLAPYTNIRERDLMRGADPRFIVEGKVTLEALIRRSRFRIDSLFLSDTRLAPLSNLLKDLPDNTPIYVTSQDRMDAVAGFPIHRGVLACALKGPSLDLENLLASAETLLVLIGLSNHDNVGACFRNAAAFGADAILLDAGACDPLYRKAIRVSAGTALTLPFHHGGMGPDLFGALERAGYRIWCLTPQRSAASIAHLKRPTKLALVLGAEGPGLPEDLIARGTQVRIPMVDGVDSINVATAGAIALSTIFGQT